MKRPLAFLLVCLLFLAPHPLSASSWLEINSAHFTVRYRPSEKKMASFLLQSAERIREVVLRDIGHSPPSPTLIYLAPTWEDFQRVQPGGQPPSWAVGTAYPDHNLIVLRSPRTVKGGRVDIEEVLQHEYAHLAMGIALKGQVLPCWLDEGCAMLQSRSWNLSWTYTLTRGILTESLIPLEDLTDGFPLSQHQAQLAYAESLSFVSFIKNEFGPAALPRLITGMANGLELEVALKEATGWGLGGLERKWKKELKKRYSWIPIVTSLLSLWFLATLLVLLGYWRTRRRTQRMLEEWEREEPDERPPIPPGASCGGDWE